LKVSSQKQTKQVGGSQQVHLQGPCYFFRLFWTICQP